MPATLQRTSTPQPGILSDFYAPGFEIEVEGRKLGPQSLGNVREVKVEMDLGEAAHFEVVLDNWDDRQADFKQIESAGRPGQPLFDLGHRLFVTMGYAGQLLPVFRGTVTALSLQFPEDGARTLTVSALDSMFRLMQRKATVVYENKADWEIAEQVAADAAIRLRTRVTKEGPKHKRVMQRGTAYATFLRDLAERNSFVFYVFLDPATGEETVVFAKSESCDTSKAPVYVLEWGKGLLSFDSTLDVSKQVSDVKVSGSNADDKRHALVGLAGPADLPTGKGRNGAAMIKQVLGVKQDLEESAPVLSAEDAKRRAVSRLLEHAYGYSTGRGKAVGFPALRPGDNVDIRGVGPRFGGCYQVNHVEHKLDSSGYVTTFSVRRPHDGGSGS